MLIIGAKGFAIEVLQVVSVDLKYNEKDIFFFDDVSTDLSNKLFNKFKILTSKEEVESYFETTSKKDFVLGLGNPQNRKALFDTFVKKGANPMTIVAKNAEIGSFDVTIGPGTCIMSGTVITNSITIGKGCLINLNCTVGHDCIIGDFVEISPNTNISGRCTIGDGVAIGTNATITPDISIGKSSVIAAGAVVTKDVPENCMVAGVPATIKKVF